ncbi:alpha/beta hydrolase [Zoogloea sp. LCSB751]|uniref:alpha/beta hydrolase n=1 Tax=Zoogloea sp. LCSB751 TaxID=1965277 RepID=UPI0009A4FECC|nr:alpha/beta hydrolase [Zoogloea sp. LCSB751]
MNIPLPPAKPARRRYLLAALGLAASPSVARAGPLLDRLRERRAARLAAADEDADGSLPAGARKLTDIAYGPDPAQTFDVYLPAAALGAPVILMVHGGAWNGGDKAMERVVDAKVARWVERDIIFVSTNYRLLPQAPVNVQLRDVARALAAAQQKAPAWGGDPRRFVLMGHSAGAHLVALLAVSPPARFTPPPLPVLGTVALDSAAMDVEAIMNQRHLRLYDRPFGTDPSYWRSLSPLHALTPGAAPLLAVCSTQREDACEQARRLANRADELGVQVQVLGEDLHHGAINSQLGLDNAYTRAVERFMAGLHPDLAKHLR